MKRRTCVHHLPPVDCDIVPNSVTCAYSCGTERGCARYERGCGVLHLIAKNQVFCGYLNSRKCENDKPCGLSGVMFPCIKIDDERRMTCCYYFDGSCGGHSSYPEGYQYPEYEFVCVFDIVKKPAVQEKKEVKKKKKSKRLF